MSRPQTPNPYPLMNEQAQLEEAIKRSMLEVNAKQGPPSSLLPNFSQGA